MPEPPVDSPNGDASHVRIAGSLFRETALRYLLLKEPIQRARSIGQVLFTELASHSASWIPSPSPPWNRLTLQSVALDLRQLELVLAAELIGYTGEAPPDDEQRRFEAELEAWTREIGRLATSIERVVRQL